MSDKPDQAGGQLQDSHHDDVESYGGGYIQAHHGGINGWLLLVYAILWVWALYYGITYWGGLGPGLDY